jgi:hypothetical protein
MLLFPSLCIISLFDVWSVLLRQLQLKCHDRLCQEFFSTHASMEDPYRGLEPRLFWIMARQVDRARFGKDKIAVYPKDVYTNFVRNSLVRAELVGHNLTMHSPATHWAAASRHLSGKVIGIVLCRPASLSSLLLYVGRQQRHVQDYWQLTCFHQCPILFLDVIACVSLERVETVYSGQAGFAPKGVFVQITSFSQQRCMAVPALGTRQALQDVILEWRNRYHHGQAFVNEFDANGNPSKDVAICMPIPHAMLCCAGAWRFWGAPVVPGRQGGALGLSLIKEWLPRDQCRHVQVDGDNDDEIPELSIDFLQGLSDVMRAQLLGTAPLEHVKFYVAWAQRLRDTMLRHRHGLSKRVYALAHMVHCMIMSGLLARRDSLFDAVVGGLKMVVKEKAVQQYYLDMLNSTRTVPSQSTLYRHRLTMHMAYCRLAQTTLAEMLASPHGVVRWGTMDASPQGGHDWMMIGFATMRVCDLADSLRLANRLYEVALRGGNDDEEAEAAEAIKVLASRLELVPGVPTTIGSGRASLAAKLHCLVHSCKLTSRTWRDCATLINSTCSWTGDLGTESGVVKATSSLPLLFGDWVLAEKGAGEVAGNDERADFAFQVEGAADVAAEAVRLPDCFLPDDPFALDWTPSIFVPGALHVLHNCTKDLKDSLVHWPNFIVSLRHLSKFLARPWSRARLVTTCFSSAPHHHFAHLYSSFGSVVYEGRWGEALKAAADVLPLQRSLRAAWSLARFNFNGHGQQRADDEESEEGVKITIVCEAIASDMFWAYLHMINIVGQAILECMHWCEGCCCHPPPQVLGSSRHQRGQAFRTRHGVDVSSCPMKTRRAPEMANNAMVKLLRQLFAQGSQMMLVVPSIAALTQEDRAMVLRDFARARQHLHLVFLVKFSHWRQLPWLLMGIAHPDHAVATACGARALSLYASSSQRVRRHPVVHLLCSPDSPSSAELVRFARHGADVGALPVLSRMCARFRFTPVAERWIESQHAAAKKQLQVAPHYSSVHLAWKGMQQWMHKSSILTNSVKLEEFADHCTLVRNAHRALIEMGFWQSPLVQDKLRSCLGSVRSFGRELRPWVVQLLYHTDADTLFQDSTMTGCTCISDTVHMYSTDIIHINRNIGYI